MGLGDVKVFEKTHALHKKCNSSLNTHAESLDGKQKSDQNRKNLLAMRQLVSARSISLRKSRREEPFFAQNALRQE
jgi:hypothetical protein